jgi:hypothetical protein
MFIFQKLHNLLGYISTTKLFGWIPLDILVHFSMGMIITILALKKLKSSSKAFLITLALAILKEIFDSFSLTASWEEALKDVLITLIYPLLILVTHSMIRKLKRSA